MPVNPTPLADGSKKLLLNPVKKLIIRSLVSENKSATQIQKESELAYRLINRTDLICQNIYKNLESLISAGIVTELYDGRKIYQLNEGCFEGYVVVRLKDKKPFLLACYNDAECPCQKDPKTNRRIPNKECMYYDIIQDITKYYSTKKSKIIWKI